jgi:hypothetical protein
MPLLASACGRVAAGGSVGVSALGGERRLSLLRLDGERQTEVVASGPFPPPRKSSVQLLDGILALDLRHRPCRFAVEVDPHRPARQSHEVAAGSGVYADGRSRHIFRRSGNRSRLVEIETDYRASSRCQAGVCDMGSLHRRHVKSGLTLAREPLRNSRHGWAGKRQMRKGCSSESRNFNRCGRARDWSHGLAQQQHEHLRHHRIEVCWPPTPVRRGDGVLHQGRAPNEPYDKTAYNGDRT